MLCNLISQARAVLKRAHVTQPHLATSFGMLDLRTIHFGASRGSGHTTTIEALTNVYTSEIICPSHRQKGNYEGRATNTKVSSWGEATRSIGRLENVEVVFIDNWIDLLKTEGNAFWKDYQKLGKQYDKAFTVFALIH